jgi:hypothetical protein
MSAEENKALVRRFVDGVQSQGNIDALDDLCSTEFVNHSAPPGVPSNREGVKQLTALCPGSPKKPAPPSIRVVHRTS